MWRGNLAHRSAAFRRQNSTKWHALTISRVLLLSTVLPPEGSASIPWWYCQAAPPPLLGGFLGLLWPLAADTLDGSILERIYVWNDKTSSNLAVGGNHHFD